MDTTCAAPLCSLSKAGRYHCPRHRAEFNPAYKKYKRAQKPINKYIIEPAAISQLSNEQLLHIISVCTRVVTLRKEYQVKAFRKELRNYSHQEFIEKLILMTDTITKALQARFSAPSLDPSSIGEDCSTDTVEELRIDTVAFRTSLLSFKKMEAELHRELDLYITQKQVLAKWIREEILKSFDAVNVYLKEPLDVSSKVSLLACHACIVENMYNQAFIDSLAVNRIFLAPCTQSEEKAEKYAELRWKDLPDTIEEMVEQIYQGNYEVPSQKDPFIAMATAVLIDELRHRIIRARVAFYFEIDILSATATAATTVRKAYKLPTITAHVIT